MWRPTPVPGTKYRPHPLASLPETLDVNYYKWSPEKKRIEAERQAIRSRLKYEYLTKLNDPNRVGPIEDPALARWVYARRENITLTGRITPTTAAMGLLYSLSPFLILTYALKVSKERREKRIKEGTEKHPDWDIPFIY